MENNSSTLHSKEIAPGKPATSVKALWLLPLGILLLESGLRLMPVGFMVRTLQVRMAEVVTLPAPRVQIMGDSVTERINAAGVEEAAGLPDGTVANYSLPGTSPVFAYYELRRELATGRVPGRIIMAPHPANLEVAMIDRFIGRFGTMKEDLDLFGHGVTAPEWLFGGLCRASVAMRYREEFRLAVTQGNFGFFETLNYGGVSVMSSRLKIAAPPEPPRAPAVSREDFPAQLSARFFVDGVNARYIDALCGLAGARGIEVDWVTVPVIGLFKERAMAQGGESKYQGYLDDLAARHSNVRLVHRELEVYPDNCFSDAWHLNPYGAWKFSRELGAASAGRHAGEKNP